MIGAVTVCGVMADLGLAAVGAVAQGAMLGAPNKFRDSVPTDTIVSHEDDTGHGGSKFVADGLERRRLVRNGSREMAGLIVGSREIGKTTEGFAPMVVMTRPDHQVCKT
jgi:hypothetical protein